MSLKKYVVTLTAEERSSLNGLITKGKASALKQRHARILLKADEEAGPACSDEEIAQAVQVNKSTVRDVRQRFVEEGLEAALERKPQKNRSRKVDGDVEAHLIAQACSKPPEGRARWTLNLLGDRLVELKVVDSISHETVRQVLKKMS